MAKRPNILKLASKISLEGMTYTGVTYNDPEYKILEPIVTDDMCKVMMHMRLEVPRTVEDIASRCKESVEFTQKQLDQLVVCGVIRIREVDGKTCYFYPIWVPGIMEGVLSNNEQCEKYPILGECFEEYARRRTEPLVPFVGRGMFFMRVMPVMSAIESNSRTASYDEISTLIEKAKAISVGPCSCRRSRRLMGEGCGHLEEDMCMYLNDNAINFSKNGEHHLISKEEAYEVLRRAEENGLVHEINQAPGFDEASAICNCCGCSCYSLRIAEMYRRPDGLRSNFRAVVEKDKCVACGQCVENCQTNALKLGQKLCEVRPTEKPDPNLDIKSSYLKKSAYNKDFRTNRSDVVDTGTAPCKSACPAHIPVQGYIKLASQGRYTEALELIKKENPFPAVCGRICNKACEDACTRGDIDSPIAIDDIKKFIAEKDLSADTRFVPKMLNQTGKPYTEKIAVIGAGPAGMSCAYYLAVKGYPVTVFEKEQMLGGMLTMGIPSFRLDKAVVNAEIEVLRELGVEFKTGVEVGKDVTLPQLREQGYKAFYLGIGASKGAPVGCPGDDLPGVFTGIDFLRAVNLGEKPALGNSVAVIGGGNVAIDVARSAVRLGAEKVTVVYRRSRDEMPAADDEITEAEEEGVRFLFLAAPVEISGNSKVGELKLERMELGEPDARGRRKPVGTGKFETIKVSAVISAIGQRIDMSGIDKGTGLQFAKNGAVIADPVTYQTAEADVFAGGDVVTGPKFAIDAIAAGKEGAVSIHRFVHKGQTLTLGRDRRDYKALDKGNVAVAIESFDTAPRQRAASGSAAEAKKTFADLRGVLTEEQMKKETERCLGCGAVVVDDYMCIGCGICTTKCKFDAIHLEKVSDYKAGSYMSTLARIAGNVPASIGSIVATKIGYKK
ncbi:MAG: FAD-dependent oxidoreductase [Firmicutes bacterium]|nr:FAD-dependent oxidoreductase [Oscillospiraceae bacterium]MBS5433390.1 FAD-dependent oxidoreductase [Bacillota bacterium]